MLPSSIGIAPNKFLAKMASNWKKPMGITILRKRDVPNMLWPLPAGDMHGVGQKRQ
ncbi:DNA polymerase IV [Bacillus safensis FO-36b] [Bacillus safensis subsp. safensis]